MEQQQTKIFVTGVRFFDKHPNAPDFVIGSMVITPNDLFQWLQQNPTALTQYNGKQQVKLSIKRSQAGQVYCELDTFKPQQQQAPAPQQGYAPAPQQGYAPAPQQPVTPYYPPQQAAPQQPYYPQQAAPAAPNVPNNLPF